MTYSMEINILAYIVILINVPLHCGQNVIFDGKNLSSKPLSISNLNVS